MREGKLKLPDLDGSPHIKLTEDHTYTLYSERYDEYLHCKGGALAKARDIFLKPLLEAFPDGAGRPLRVLEVGFGAGLNFFVTADALCDREGLEYVALENELIAAALLRELQYETLLKRPAIVERYLAAREAMGDNPAQGKHFITLNDNVALTLLLGDACEAALPDDHFDWAYLDPFSPATNPELWTDAFIGMLYRSLRSGGGLSSYCVKGEVRRVMKRAGFQVEKRPGILYKREVLVARK